MARVAAARGRRAIPATCRSCTASAASAASPSTSCRGSPATRTRRRCASATPRATQFQLDVYGEVLDALHQTPPQPALEEDRTRGRCSAPSSSSSRAAGRTPTKASGRCAGRAAHFTHSKVMAWVAFDRAVKAIEQFGLEGPVDRWRPAARRDPRRRCASRASTPSATPSRSTTARSPSTPALLMIPLVGFLPATDPRVVGHRRRDRARAARRRLRAPLPTRTTTSTASRPARACSSRARSGWPTTCA